MYTQTEGWLQARFHFKVLNPVKPSSEKQHQHKCWEVFPNFLLCQLCLHSLHLLHWLHHHQHQSHLSLRQSYQPANECETTPAPISRATKDELFLIIYSMSVDNLTLCHTQKLNENRNVLWPVALNSVASNASFSSSFSRTSPSVTATASDSHLSQSLNPEIVSTPSNIAMQLNGITKTLGLKLPNIAINTMTTTNVALPGSVPATNTERMNKFLFGQQQKQSQYLPFPQMSALPNIGASYDIDKALANEVNKKEMRQIVSCQLDQIKQQMMRQEREDAARVEALKFMKMIQTTQPHNIQKVINPLPITPALSCTVTPPLLLPQLLHIPPLKETKSVKASLSASSSFAYAHNIKKQQLRMPKMSDGNEWNAVSKQAGKCNKDYKGYGRDTLLAAAKQIQSRSEMSQNQIEIVCNCMIELSFTEKLNCKNEENEKKMVIDSEKISSLNMNLNASSKKKMNGFSPLFRSQNDFNVQSAFNIALPTFKQTSNSFMPGLEMEISRQNDYKLPNLVSSAPCNLADSYAATSSDDSENEIILKKAPSANV